MDLNANFVHLHNHSDRSALDSISKPRDIARRAKELGMPAVAITDHGVVAASLELYKACQAETKPTNEEADWNEAWATEIKPIIGCEAYLSPTDDHALAKRLDDHPDYYHINLLAMNADGVSQLYKLSSMGFLEGFYRKPRISLPLIEEYGSDLLVLGACVKGPVSWNLFTDNPDRANYFVRRLQNSFGDRFYLEVIDHGEDWQAPLNEKIISIADEYNITVVPTNDAHFLRREDHYVHSLMLCLQMRKTLNEHLSEGKMLYPENCYMRTADEMESLFGSTLCKNTLEVAARTNIQFELNKSRFPTYTAKQASQWFTNKQ